MLHMPILISGGVILEQLFNMSGGAEKKIEKLKNWKWGCCSTLVMGLNGPGTFSWVCLLWGTYLPDKCTSVFKAHSFEKKTPLSFPRHEALKFSCFRYTFPSSGNSFIQIKIVKSLLCTTFLYYLFEELNLENILTRTGKGLFKDNYKKKIIGTFQTSYPAQNINGTSLYL